MEEIRKNAYRNLLYRAMIDIRTLCQPRGNASYNPVKWYRQYHRCRVAGAIADWLHNLAYYAARDFTRFEENQFWQQFERIRTRFSNYHLDYYQELFNHFLEDPKHTGIWQCQRKAKKGAASFAAPFLALRSLLYLPAQHILGSF